MNPEPAAPSPLPDFPLGDRTVRPGLNRIDGPEGPVQVEPKVMEVLVCLAGCRGRPVSKEELVRDVWAGRFVSDDVVWRSIGELRRALGDAGLIRTVPKRGYLLAEPAPPALVPAPAEPSPARVAPRWLWAALALVLAVGLIAAFRFDRSAPRPAPGKVRLAVLPFENLSGDPSQDYFSEGLTEELISRLGSLKPEVLGVIGRTSVAALAKQGGDPRGIGRALGADYLLEGGVRREGDRVRVTARLVQTSDQTTVWSESHDLTLWGTLHLQSRVAEQVAGELALELLPAELSALGLAAAANPEAHDAYLKGLYFLHKGMPDDLRRAADAFERSVALDPRSAKAHAGLADALHLLVLFGALAPGEAYPRAEAEARRALELDGSLAETRATLGSILWRRHWDWAAAEEEFRAALAANPSSAVAHHDYAWYLVALGRFEEALTEIRAAQALDPLSPRASADVGWVYYRAGRDAEAVRQMRRTLELEPRFLSARHCLEGALLRQGRPGEALAEARQSLGFEGAAPEEIQTLTAGDPAAALRRIAVWRLAKLEARARERYVSPYALAARRATAGEANGALAALEKAFEERDPSLASVAVDPAFAPLRKEPRFRDLVERIGLP